jgi:hypothetical protein
MSRPPVWYDGGCPSSLPGYPPLSTKNMDGGISGESDVWKIFLEFLWKSGLTDNEIILNMDKLSYSHNNILVHLQYKNNKTPI